jgi:hypothetical protein
MTINKEKESYLPTSFRISKQTLTKLDVIRATFALQLGIPHVSRAKALMILIDWWAKRNPPLVSRPEEGRPS